MKRIRFPRLAYNMWSMAGAVIALTAGATMTFFLVIERFIHEPNQYLGIVVYMVLPPVLAVGLLLIPIGMLRKKRRIRQMGEELPPQWPALDLNIRTHRNAFFVFIVGTVGVVLLAIFGGYHAYHFTESVEFCGETCHSVMKPEFTAYHDSPHARVACVSCHVGPGAGWYAKSKLSGAYQVYSVTFNKYSRPIETPIRNLRPAQEVCEQCHWPQKFFGDQKKRFDHYMYDDENSHWPIVLLIKTGGGDPGSGHAEGIHWHMNISSKVEYIARDERRQDIPWVRVTNRTTGEVTVYHDEEDPLNEEEIAQGEVRTMDCVDCHNRPSHNYHPPDYLVDRVLASGRADVTLPEFKRVAVELMEEEYETEDQALAAIASGLHDFYSEEYEDVFESQREAIDAAVAAVQEQYATNMFPEMKVRWDAYPDNIGHLIFPGCMRCHDGNHVSESGKTVSRDCRSCHTILFQGTGERAQMAQSLDGLEFVHPEDIDEEWKTEMCSDCHEGVQP